MIETPNYAPITDEDRIKLTENELLR